MPKYMIKLHYTSASWARLLKVTDDRTSAVAALVEALGGKLESIYWEIEDSAVYVVGDLPDSHCAAAAITAATRTGAFKDLHVSELLDQEGLQDVVALAKSTEGVYHPPGAAAVESDL